MNGGGRKEIPTSLHSQWRRLWYSCQRIEIAGALDIFFFCTAPLSISPDGVGVEKGVPAGLTLSGGVFDMHASGSVRRACG